MAQIQDLLNQLRAQIQDLPTLLSLITAPLDAINLLAPQFRRYNTRPLEAFNLHKHIPQLQRLILTHVVPVWEEALIAEGANTVLDQYFCPDSFSNAQPAAGEVAILAYSTLMASTSDGLTDYAIRILQRLVVEYPVDRLYSAVYSSSQKDKLVRGVIWEDCVKNICMVPGKVANARGTAGDVPPMLENGMYFNNLSIRCEVLIFSLSPSLDAFTYFLSKLVNVGLFPASPPHARSQPSFFHTTLPIIRQRLASQHPAYSTFWSNLFLNIPSILTLQSILTSLFGSLESLESSSLNATDDSPTARARIKNDAALLEGLVGEITPEKEDLWQIVTSLITGSGLREWPESHARIFVCWVSGASRGARVNLKALDALLQVILDIWSSPEHVKHSLISRHRYTTSLLLLTISYFPPSSPSLQDLVSHPGFIKGIGVYISHLDHSVRRLGMLAAEVIAHLAGKRLAFGGWDDGDDNGKDWCRALRKLIKARDADASLAALETDLEPPEEIIAPAVSKPPPPPRATFTAKTTGAAADAYDSDDSITGYASPASSSRSPSPTPSELLEIEKDPTLNVGLKKVPRPVYLAQLGDLLRGGASKTGPDDPHEADRIEMALNCAEELVRRKKGYGSELDENAVNLVYALLSLQDNFDLESFSEKRQGAMNALISCAPRKATPALIQEFFKNQYSTDQRFVALNALALGARELASLPIPPSRVPPERTVFPSKMLPAPLHRKYIAADREVVPRLLDDISKRALDSQSETAATTVPELVRHRRLRVQKPHGVTEIPPPTHNPLNPYTSLEHNPLHRSPQPKMQFIDVAAEFFIVPLINRFWAFLRDEQTREERTAHRDNGPARYVSVGTGLILNPLVLAQFLRTLAILVNASQNAPEWLAIIAPESLELAVTIGTRPVSHMNTDPEEEEEGNGGEDRQSKEASVLTSALELALVVLDGALEIDGGRILSLEHTTLVFGLGEWAGKVFASLEKGLKVQGGGGMHEARLSRAAAGVLLKVDELTSKWRRSMLDTI
ncbi:hypothetical protein M413DRAFT_438113 [Hebeloma cylindrosporum]|uniref:Telomere length regulation protein conserved domain-containing protein n=1 Tax=Hebeloma cylindrosporum TaxID=76867 RepID=A0A0C2Z6Z9_HEBCY|nr:hypothetical protein M413DRAFT_438113 [Hebeloma cylindrosporum h7]